MYWFLDKYTYSEFDTCIGKALKQAPGARKEAIPLLFKVDKKRQYDGVDGERRHIRKHIMRNQLVLLALND